MGESLRSIMRSRFIFLLISLSLLSINNANAQLADGIKICKSEDNNVCLGLSGDYASWTTGSDSSMNWRFKQISGNGNLYLENLSRCKVLTVHNGWLKVAPRRDSSSQDWIVRKIQEHWYDDLYFRFESPGDTSSTETKVLDANSNWAQMRPLLGNSNKQKFVIKEALDIRTTCLIQRDTDITPFSVSMPPSSPCNCRRVWCDVRQRCVRKHPNNC